ncbi:MAG: ComF family protein [Candidatus Eremiobacteraeota bacterium]|nr:ComF family protein [Candidatus Eremiobacteraeota bacterium]
MKNKVAGFLKQAGENKIPEEEGVSSSIISEGLNLLREMGHGFLELLFPLRCAGCSACKSTLFCNDCRKSLEVVPGPKCPVCGRPLSDKWCYDCKRQKPFFHRADSLYIYKGPIRNALLAWKYKRIENLGPVMAEIFIDGLKKDKKFIQDVDVVIPVPLHESRIKERGFNQSEILAEAISSEFGIPMRTRNLKRNRATALQSRLNREQRQNNVRGAFSVLWARELYRKRILIVDDIMTTGVTLNECARVLRNAGAKQVTGITLCRDIPEGFGPKQEK